MREIRVIALANLTTKYNPYFMYFNMKFDPNREFTKDKGRGVLIHHFVSQKYRKTKALTPFARLIQGTEYGAFQPLIKHGFVKVGSFGGYTLSYSNGVATLSGPNYTVEQRARNVANMNMVINPEGTDIGSGGFFTDCFGFSMYITVDPSLGVNGWWMASPQGAIS